MPTCEKCAHELTGSAGVCRRCGFYNARRRVDEWREQRRTPPASRLAPEPPQTAPPLKPGARAPRLRPHDSTLIPFPSVARPPAARARAAAEPQQPESLKPEPSAPESKNQAADSYPPWRKDLTERVRQIREQKARREQAGGRYWAR
jgi:ribosomal protein L40E